MNDYLHGSYKKYDHKKITKPTKKEKEEYLLKYGCEIPKDYIQVNCYMIPEKELSNNPDMTGEYNVARNITSFNKRIEPLLVVFKPEIRENILIEDPADEQQFTKKQSELVSGFPLKEGGQDSMDEVMTLSDGEVLFWNRVNKDPFFMYVEDSLNYVDQKWVEYNRKVVSFQAESVKEKHEEDDLIEKNGHDYALHAAIED